MSFLKTDTQHHSRAIASMTIVCLVSFLITIAALSASGSLFSSPNITTVVALLTIMVIILNWTVHTARLRKEVSHKEVIQRLTNELEKANKRLRELDTLKSEFVSIASHQLRTPLTAIRGYASMLTEGAFGKIPDKAKEPLSRIEQSSRYMSFSVDDFLSVSRIESGTMNYTRNTFSFSELASSIVDETRGTAVKRGLVLRYASDSDSEMHVHADEQKVRQVLRILIDNAMKYTSKGRITVTAYDDTKARKAYVSVVDTGVGMSNGTAETIFDAFVRAKNAHHMNVYGIGLGLYIAKQIALAMGGNVTASSKGEGKGSTFIVELPLKK